MWNCSRLVITVLTLHGRPRRRNVSLREATKATPRRWLAILAAIYVSSMAGFFRGDWFSLFAFPVVAWLVGVNTCHDVTHFALATNWRIKYCYQPYIYPFFSIHLCGIINITLDTTVIQMCTIVILMCYIISG